MPLRCLLSCLERDPSKWEVDSPKAWSIVLGSFFAHFAVLGLSYSFGIFVLPISEEFGVTRAEVALVGTINQALFFLCGIFAGALGDKYGTRPIMSIGLVIWLVGCIGASFCNEFGLLFLTQGVMIGFGSSFVYWPAITVVPQWFNTYRGTAVGFAALGAGIGNLVFALVGQQIVTALGWRDTLRVSAGFGGALMLFSVVVMERRVPPVVNKNGLFFVGKRLIKQPAYQWFILSCFLFQWGFFIPFIHLAAYVRDLGLSSTTQGLALGMIGIGSSVGRVVMGPVADKCGRMFVFRMCLFAAGGTLAVWPACTTEDSIYAFAFMYGLFGGGFICLSPVISGDMWGVANLGGTFAVLNIANVPGALASGPVAGVIYDTYGTYWPAIWFGAGCIILSASALLMVRKPQPVEEAEGVTIAAAAAEKDEEEAGLAPSPAVATDSKA